MKSVPLYFNILYAESISKKIVGINGHASNREYMKAQSFPVRKFKASDFAQTTSAAKPKPIILLHLALNLGSRDTTGPLESPCQSFAN